MAATHPQVRVIHHPENVGLNGVALSVKAARGYYVIKLDDDVMRFPDDWLPKLLHAFKKVPEIGYMACNVVQDELTTGEKEPPEAYTVVDHDGVVLEHGPTWGWCTMTSLDVLEAGGQLPAAPRAAVVRRGPRLRPPLPEGGVHAGHLAGCGGLSCFGAGQERPVRLSARTASRSTRRPPTLPIIRRRRGIRREAELCEGMSQGQRSVSCGAQGRRPACAGWSRCR